MGEMQKYARDARVLTIDGPGTVEYIDPQDPIVPYRVMLDRRDLGEFGMWYTERELSPLPGDAFPPRPWTGTGPEWKALVERVGREALIGATVSVPNGETWCIERINTDGISGECHMMYYSAAFAVTLYALAGEKKADDCRRCGGAITALYLDYANRRFCSEACRAAVAGPLATEEKPAAKPEPTFPWPGCKACAEEDAFPMVGEVGVEGRQHSLKAKCPKREEYEATRRMEVMQSKAGRRSEFDMKDWQRMFGFNGTYAAPDEQRPPPRIHALEDEVEHLVAADVGRTVWGAGWRK